MKKGRSRTTMRAGASPRQNPGTIQGTVPRGTKDDVQGDALTDALAERLRKTGIGGRLPSERALSEELGASRTALRDRLQLFESLGALERLQGSGTYVRYLEPSRLAVALSLSVSLGGLGVEGLYSVRKALERQAAIEAAERPGPAGLEALENAVDRMRTARSERRFEAADIAFHDELLRAAGNDGLSFFADSLALVLRRGIHQRLLRLPKLSGVEREVVRAHEAILEAVRSRDGETAARAVDDHFATFDRLREAAANGAASR